MLLEMKLQKQGGVYTFEGISPWPIEGLALLFLKERGYK